MAIEYLGHKRALLDFVTAPILAVTRRADRVGDVFCGTGAVSERLKSKGLAVVANDQLTWCSTFTQARLLNDGPPPFVRLSAHLKLRSRKDRYQRILAHLEALPPKRGFTYWHYSPAAARRTGVVRKYFTEENAGRIDAVRTAIQVWEPLLTEGERALLIHDLIEAVNSVSNVAGTYGCYLKSWKPRALEPLRLMSASFLASGSSCAHEVYCSDAESLAPRLDCAVIYADPPYTKRQYAAYYHVLETIAKWDRPRVLGSTGLRPWRAQASNWCYKRRAPEALRQLVRRLQCRHFFLSYNEDGHIGHADVLRILGERGRVEVFETKARRYKSSAREHRGSVVLERLYHLRVGA